MKTITLIRHAKVDISNTQKMYAKELQTWIKLYDESEIEKSSKPSLELVEFVKGADYVMTSSLKRAIDSASVLGVFVQEKNEMFDELDIPTIDVKYLKVTPKTWLVILRLSMMFSMKQKSKTWIEALKKADKAAGYLIELTTKHDSVVLVGHGGLHWLTQKALRKRGWKVEGKPSFKNWGRITLCI